MTFKNVAQTKIDLLLLLRNCNSIFKKIKKAIGKYCVKNYIFLYYVHYLNALLFGDLYFLRKLSGLD